MRRYGLGTISLSHLFFERLCVRPWYYRASHLFFARVRSFPSHLQRATDDRPLLRASGTNIAAMSLLVAEAKLWLQIAPAYLGDVDLGIREQLNASLLQHVSALNGAVLAYDSLKLLDGLGCIRNDLPHIHLPVSLRILVFAPRVGDVLLGVVTRQGTDHTALVVHGRFPASVASAKQRAEGKLMRFVVRSLQVTDGMLSLKGDHSSSASRAGGAEHVPP